MTQKPTFLDDVLSGAATAGDIDTYISRWHDSDEILNPLHVALGMTREQYHTWCQTPSALPDIIEAHRKSQTPDT